MSLVLFPDVEAWLVRYLQDALDDRPEPYCTGVVVGIDLDNPRPARAVQVRRDGGPRLDAVRELARLGINVWAGTDAEVTDLAGMVRALIAACPDGQPVVKSTEQSGPTPIPDESGPRRYLVTELIVRGTAA
jgi:hypothetical protein